MTSTRRWEGVRLMWTGRGDQAPCGRPHRKLKLESNDIILSSSHAKKLASFYQNFVFGWNKKWKLFGDKNVTQSMKRYQVLVHSFVRNQLEWKSGSIFAKQILFAHRNDTSL